MKRKVYITPLDRIANTLAAADRPLTVLEIGRWSTGQRPATVRGNLRKLDVDREMVHMESGQRAYVYWSADHPHAEAFWNILNAVPSYMDDEGWAEALTTYYAEVG